MILLITFFYKYKKSTKETPKNSETTLNQQNNTILFNKNENNPENSNNINDGTKKVNNQKNEPINIEENNESDIFKNRLVESKQKLDSFLGKIIPSYSTLLEDLKKKNNLNDYKFNNIKELYNDYIKNKNEFYNNIKYVIGNLISICCDNKIGQDDKLLKHENIINSTKQENKAQFEKMNSIEENIISYTPTNFGVHSMMKSCIYGLIYYLRYILKKAFDDKFELYNEHFILRNNGDFNIILISGGRGDNLMILKWYPKNFHYSFIIFAFLYHKIIDIGLEKNFDLKAKIENDINMFEKSYFNYLENYTRTSGFKIDKNSDLDQFLTNDLGSIVLKIMEKRDINEKEITFENKLLVYRESKINNWRQISLSGKKILHLN